MRIQQWISGGAKAGALAAAVLVAGLERTAWSQEAKSDPIPVATPTAAAKAKEAELEKSKRPLTCTIQLASGAELQGTFMDVPELAMKTSFGEAKLPLSEVSGVKLASEKIPSTTVVMHNGDSLTGAVDVPRVSLETEWGKAEINGSHIASILFVQGVKWAPDTTTAGARWKLVDDKPADKPADAKKPAAAAPGTPAGTAARPAAPGTPASGTTVVRPGFFFPQ